MKFTIYHHRDDLPAMKITANYGRLTSLVWLDKVGESTQSLIMAQESFFVDCRQSILKNDTDAQLLKQATIELDEYFAGLRQKFDVALDLSSGTAFQQSVWRALMTIGYGKTTSYKQLACDIGKPKSYRALANANRCNPIALLVPCHRVIAHDGGLGGYLGNRVDGTAIKQILLDIERS